MGVFEKNFEFVGHSQYSSNFAHKNGFFFCLFPLQQQQIDFGTRDNDDNWKKW